MVETAELLAFAQVVDARSVSKAARDLGEPRATISRRLARLEKRLATRLIRRTTRSLAVTDAGEALYRHARIVLDAAASAEASVRTASGVIAGDLRATTPHVITPGFHAMLAEFVAAHPRVRLQLMMTNRHVDLLREGYDVAIRASWRLEPGLIARKLAEAPVIAVASPAYIAANGQPRTKRELANHQLLVGFARGEVPQTHWPWRGGQVAITGAFASNDLALLLESAIRGLGIALVPGAMARPALEAGVLVHVLAGLVTQLTQVAVVYPERELVPPQVRAFVDHVLAWAPRAFKLT